MLSIPGPNFNISNVRWICFILLLSLFCLGAATLPAQTVLTVSYQGTNLVFDATNFAALPHTEITATDPHEKKDHQYSAVSVHDLLVQAGAPLGEKLRGAALHDVVMVRAKDGYAVAFTLADFDEAYSTRNLVLADRVDGNPLSDTAGPLRLIVAGDKKGARWVRMVNKIEVLNTEQK
jgi:hypothetical protein